MDLEPGDILVARLWRWDADRLEKDAHVSYRDAVAVGVTPDYSISVFGIKIDNAEVDEEEQKRSLCALIERASKYVTFTTARRLEDEGFTVRESEPPPCHYDVVIGDSLSRDRVERLELVLNEHEKEVSVVFDLTMHGLTRVTVDPNSASRRDPDLVVMDITDADGPIKTGDFVVAVQPDDDAECDFVGSAVVSHVDDEHGLIYLHVDWSSFAEDQFQTFVMPITIPGSAVSITARGRVKGHLIGANSKGIFNGAGIAALAATS